MRQSFLSRSSVSSSSFRSSVSSSLESENSEEYGSEPRLLLAGFVRIESASALRRRRSARSPWTQIVSVIVYDI